MREPPLNKHGSKSAQERRHIESHGQWSLFSLHAHQPPPLVFGVVFFFPPLRQVVCFASVATCSCKGTLKCEVITHTHKVDGLWAKQKRTPLRKEQKKVNGKRASATADLWSLCDPSRCCIPPFWGDWLFWRTETGAGTKQQKKRVGVRKARKGR